MQGTKHKFNFVLVSGGPHGIGALLTLLKTPGGLTGRSADAE